MPLASTVARIVLFTAGLFVISGHATLASARVAKGKSIFQLFCGGQINGSTGAAQSVVVTKAVLNDNRFTAWVDLGISEDAVRLVPHLRLATDRGWGYRLDGLKVTEIHPLVDSTGVVMAVSFFGLPAGRHRLVVGLVDPFGALVDSNAYCFSTPGHSSWTWPPL